MAQSRPDHKRLVLAALVGAASSLIILLPALSVVVTVLIKLLLSVLIVCIAFGRKRLVKHLLLFYLVNFSYAGLMTATLQLVNLNGVLFEGGVLYFELSAMRLCLLTVLAYGVIQLASTVLAYTTSARQTTTLRIMWNNQTVTLTALLDSGNLLRDTVTALPVVICKSAGLEGFFTVQERQQLASLRLDQLPDHRKQTFHLVPINGVGGQTLLPVFQPTTVQVWGKEGWHSCRAVVAISDRFHQQDFEAIVPAKLIT